jgi:uncharacterized protein YqhQ
VGGVVKSQARRSTLSEAPLAAPVPYGSLSPVLRIGGMAFGNGVLMRSKGFWALARSDGSVLDGRVFSLLYRSRLARLPLVRSLVALVEMIVFAVRLQRRNGLRLNLRLLGWLALWLVVSSWLGSLAYRLLGGGLGGDLVAQLASLLLGLVCLQRGMGTELWRYHGAEHKVVNAYEAGADLGDPEAVMAYSRIHDRCGTNLVVIIVFLLMVGYLPLGGRPLADVLGGFYSVGVVVVSLELFRLVGRWPRSLAGRVVLSGGKALQRCLTTREPAREHLEPACVALRRVVELDRTAQSQRLADTTSPRFDADWASFAGRDGRR